MATAQVLNILLKDMTILYAEDDLSTQNIISEILMHFCDNVKLASNGEEAFEIFKKEDIDLIISDIEMPRTNGLEFIKNVREIDPIIPVIMISAYNLREYLLGSINLRIEGYILKPITYTKIEKLLIQAAKTINEKKLIRSL
jgi:YesN/AraC family two-component response regulator